MSLPPEAHAVLSSLARMDTHGTEPASAADPESRAEPDPAALAAESLPETPAFVYEERRILDRLALFDRLRERSGARLLYSVKAMPLAGLLELMAPEVDGFSASSLFEARLIREVRGPQAPLHLTTPGLRESDIAELGRLCTAISFNSLEQCRRWLPRLSPNVAFGVRVNPRLPVVEDLRYDPCRPHSKLGVPLEDLGRALAEEATLARRLSGLHFHTHYGVSDAAPLQQTLAAIEASLGARLSDLRWINIGGGYHPRTVDEADALAKVIRRFRDRQDLECWLEPGKALVGDAGVLLTTVIDTFSREGQAVAVLDTGVHHLPEVFEYQRAPQVREHDPTGAFPCLLAGSTCLAGDLLGIHRFIRPLHVGDRLTLEGVGAYSLVKASRFNGYDLPAVYLRERKGGLRRLKSFGYADYRRSWLP